MKKLSDSKYIEFITFTAYLLVAHLFIPYFFGGKDIFWLSSWNLFSFKTTEFVYDISCDGGKSFLLRDRPLENAGIKPLHLMNLLNNQRKSIPEPILQNLINNYNCTEPVLYKIKGSFYNHFIEKSFEDVLERKPL